MGCRDQNTGDQMLKELTEYGNNKKEEVKLTLNEIKKNLQWMNSEGDEARIQINNLEQKEELIIQAEEQKETRVEKKIKQR